MVVSTSQKHNSTIGSTTRASAERKNGLRPDMSGAYRQRENPKWNCLGILGRRNIISHQTRLT